MCPRRAPRGSRVSQHPLRPRAPKLGSLLVLGAGVLIGAGILLWQNVTPEREETGAHTRRPQVQPRALSSGDIRRVAGEVDVQRLWSAFIRPMLIERPPGTEGNRLVRELISGQLRALSGGWEVTHDTFHAATPRGTLAFGSVVATLDPAAPRRLVLACHLDSKWFLPDSSGRPFVGATDSAVPCALILEAVTALDPRLRRMKERASPVTLQLFFLDGEEALLDWSETDSLYGARHLAQRLDAEPMPGGAGNQLEAIDLFVLLDLLGAPDLLVLNHFEETRGHFMRLLSLERRLHSLGLLESHSAERSYFRADVYYGPVADDHLPFLRRGVPVLHVISTPFPAVWHTHQDNEENLHRPTVANLCRIMAAFLSETLAL